MSDFIYKNVDRNNCFYEYFLRTKILDIKGNIPENELIERISHLANFAWRNHSGFFSDGRIENILFSYGKNLETCVDRGKIDKQLAGLLPDDKNDYSIIHVATKLFGVGGHTRALYQFIKRHEGGRQLLILTGQSKQNVPEWFREGIENVKLLSLDSIGSTFERAYILRHLANRAKHVVLYHHPDDVVPVIALSHNTRPPVILLDHAHSWFWLGASIIDMVLAPSEFHKKFTLAKRPLKNVIYFPFTQLEDLDGGFSPDDKLAAKKQLGLNPATLCMMTIGTTEKFVPNAHYNFYTTAKKIIKRFDTVELFVIGVQENSAIREKYNLHSTRIHFLGFVDDPTDYYKAADICLDALPQPSLGGTIYAALIGLACPMFKYGASNVFNGKNLFTSSLYGRYVGMVNSEAEYLDKLEFLADNHLIRIGIAEEIRSEYLAISTKESLAKTVKETLSSAKFLKHTPLPIPDGKYFRDADSAEIADAGFVQNLHGTFMHFDRYLTLWDKLTFLTKLLISPCYSRDVIKLVVTILRNRMKLSGFFFSRPGGFYGSTDCILSPPISPHSGK